MFKKIALTVLTLWGVVVPDNPELVAGIVGGAVVAGGIVYLAKRESNASKIERFYKIRDAYQGRVEQEIMALNSPRDIIAFVQQGSSRKHELEMIANMVGQIKKELGRRYSWLTPWNWTDSMKRANEQACYFYEEVQFLVDLFVWTPCWQVMQQFDNSMRTSVGHDYFDLLGEYEDRMLIAVRMIGDGHSSYPLISAFDKINFSIQSARHMSLRAPCVYVFIDMLEKIKLIVTASASYITERKAYDEYLLRQREVKAEEEKARAQRDQANAQYQQAMAAQERNRIEQAKLKTDKDSYFKF